jgi:biopolymer transport protein ExbD
MGPRLGNERFLVTVYPLILIGVLLVPIIATRPMNVCYGDYVVLPQVSRADFIVGREPICQISLTHFDRTLFDGAAIESEEVAPRLRRRRAQQPALRVVVSVDHTIPFGRVRKVLTAVQEAGFRTMKLEVESAGTRLASLGW